MLGYADVIDDQLQHWMALGDGRHARTTAMCGVEDRQAHLLRRREQRIEHALVELRPHGCIEEIPDQRAWGKRPG